MGIFIIYQSRGELWYKYGLFYLPVLADRQGKNEMFPMGRGSHDGNYGLLHFRRKAIPTTTCSIFGRILHLQTALRSQWDKCRKNNSLFASPSIRRPTGVHWNLAVIKEHFQVFFLIDGVIKAFPCFAFLGCFRDVFFYPYEIGLHQRADA